MSSLLTWIHYKSIRLLSFLTLTSVPALTDLVAVWTVNLNYYAILDQSIYIRYLLLQNNRPHTEWLRTTNIYCPVVSLNQKSGRRLARYSERGGLSWGCLGLGFSLRWAAAKESHYEVVVASKPHILLTAVVWSLSSSSCNILQRPIWTSWWHGSPIVDDTKEHVRREIVP